MGRDEGQGARKCLSVIDGAALVYRSHYALTGRYFSTRAGEPTGATYGVSVYLLRLLREERPDYLAVALDTPAPTFRHGLLPSYKADRPPMPPELVAQLPRIRQVMEAMGTPVIELEGFEADDIMATLARRGEEAGMDVRLHTVDKDLCQVVDEHVVMISPPRRGGSSRILDEEGVRARLGVGPGSVVDFLSLAGDATDGIPGVPGIGPKGAAALLAQYGSVEEIYRHLEEIPASVRDRLREHEERVRGNRELTAVVTDLPLPVTWEELAVRPLTFGRVAPVFRELEFRRLLETLKAQTRGSPSGSPPAAGETDSWESFGRHAPGAEGLAVEIDPAEGGGRSVPCGVAMALPDGRATYLPWRERREGEDARSWERMSSLFADGSLPKWTSDLKRLQRLVAAGEGRLAGPLFDTTLAARLLGAEPAAGEGAPGAGAGSSAAGMGGKPRGKKRRETSNLELHWDPAAKSDEGVERAREVARRVPELQLELRRRGLRAFFSRVEIPLAGILAEMETAGVTVDLEELRRLSADMERKLRSTEEEVYREAGGPFNINSTRQLKEVLFGRLGLPPGRRTKSGFSTDARVLSRLAREHPLPGMILRHRHLAKLRATFIEGLLDMVNPRTGRLHTTFEQSATATGRLSSRDPNLQNIPIRSDEGRAIRRVFVAGEPGWHLVVADYSQIELRVLAHFAGDEALREAFRQGEDVHRETASAVFRVAPTEVTDSMRQRAKMVNYGIIYGMGSRSLAEALEIEPREARAFIDSYFETYPGAGRFLEDAAIQAREKGFVATLAGRRRYFPELQSSRREVRALAERAAVNTRIQGTAADIMKEALVRVHARLRSQGRRARLLLTVHDELVLEAPADETILELLEVVAEEMKAAWSLDVPVEVKVGHAPNWLDAHA